MRQRVSTLFRQKSQGSLNAREESEGTIRRVRTWKVGSSDMVSLPLLPPFLAAINSHFSPFSFTVLVIARRTWVMVAGV